MKLALSAGCYHNQKFTNVSGPCNVKNFHHQNFLICLATYMHKTIETHTYMSSYFITLCRDEVDCVNQCMNVAYRSYVRATILKNNHYVLIQKV